jgi:hypothetical protein
MKVVILHEHGSPAHEYFDSGMLSGKVVLVP